MTRPKPNAKSLANLVMWKPGQSGNPAGRIPGRVYVSEWVSTLLGRNSNGTAKYSKDDLEKIVDDKSADVDKSIAAAWLLNCMKTGESWVVGKDGDLMPARLDAEPGRERERLLDRLDGKPAVTVTHRQEAVPELSELHDQLSALIDANPGLRSLLPHALAQATSGGHSLGGRKPEESDDPVIEAEWQASPDTSNGTPE